MLKYILQMVHKMQYDARFLFEYVIGIFGATAEKNHQLSSLVVNMSGKTSQGLRIALNF